MENLRHYKILADMFRYPDEHFQDYMDNFRDLVLTGFSEKQQELKQTIAGHNQLSLKEKQEYYLRTFDVRPVCYLDIGYVLFGEDYKRAQLLVNLQSEHKNAGVDCGSELGDHLPNVLCLLSKTTDRNFAEELGFILTLPAVKFMLTKFDKIGLHFYKTLLEVLYESLKRDFKGESLLEFAVPEQAFSSKKEFLMPSPKTAICDTLCHKHKKI